jgi:hypothetical protein
MCEIPMTILGAVHDGHGTLLVAADSAQVNTDSHSEAATVRLVEKLSPLGEHLVWGWHGSDGRGDRIGAYLASLDAIADWPTLEDGCGPAVKNANAEGWIGAPGTRTQCLIAGLIGRRPGVLVVDADGKTQFSDDALFVGWGRVAALVGWQVAKSQESSLSFEERFVNVMELTIATVWGLEPPLSLWRITALGCDQLRGLDDSSG